MESHSVWLMALSLASVFAVYVSEIGREKKLGMSRAGRGTRGCFGYVVFHGRGYLFSVFCDLPRGVELGMGEVKKYSCFFFSFFFFSRHVRAIY
jgi:hypothetical protein